jgi:hypothetical protein
MWLIEDVRPMPKNILEYATRTPPKRRLWIETISIAFATVPAHFIFSFYAGICLDGVFNSSTMSWISIAWLPAGIAFKAQFDHAGFIFQLLGSLIAGVVTASTAARCLFKTEPPAGSYYWRLWLTLCLWLFWLPVPYAMAVIPYD